MDTLVAGFWGAFFGTVALMLAGSLAAFIRSLHRVALNAALSALISAGFVVAYLGWLPMPNARAEGRLLAQVASLSSAILALMLLAMLGLMRKPEIAWRARWALWSLAAAVLGVGWLLEPQDALALSSLMAFGVGAVGLAVCLRNAVKGDPLGWVAVSGVFFMVTAVAGLSWIALDREGVPWQVHAGSAVAGMAYLTSMASALWARYSYLIELREVMAHGPGYDPVTRMRSHAETAGHMVGAAFYRHEGERTAVGVIAISIANLYALENLHGRAAVNHALFVFGSRLRRHVPTTFDMGRLGEDGFLLLKRHAERDELAELARQLAEGLQRAVSLSAARTEADIDAAALQWRAEVGIGVLLATPPTHAGAAVRMARAMSRTAWSYPSRLAWFDRSVARIAELPAA